MIYKVYCLYVGVMLYGGAIVLIFIRALVKKKLVKDYKEYQGTQTSKEGDDVAKYRFGISNVFGISKTITRSLNNMPASSRSRYNIYRLATWAATLFVSLMILFSIVAHDICTA